MKLSRTVGLAIAVSLVAGTVAALAQIGGAAPARPTANVVDAAEQRDGEERLGARDRAVDQTRFRRDRTRRR